MMRVLTCVTFMLHSLCVCCLSVRVDSCVSRVGYMIDPDASRNQSTGKFLTDILEVCGISADMFHRTSTLSSASTVTSKNQSHILGPTLCFSAKKYQFVFVELMVSMAIIGVLSAMSVPSLKAWSRNYNVQSAALDLYAHMHVAKLGAGKKIRAWMINFNPDGLSGYQVQTSAGKTVKTVDFHAKYNSDIQYADPTTTKTFGCFWRTAFRPNGLVGTGYAYISNKSKSSYYRVGMLYATGSIKIEKWNGAQWE